MKNRHWFSMMGHGKITAVAVVLPVTLRDKLRGWFHKNEQDKKFDAGWSVGWLNGFWVLSFVFLTAALHVYLNFPGLQWLAFLLLLLSLNLFLGNLVVRSAKHTKYLTLPWVNLFPDHNAQILDAGCGAGRTTLALSKIFQGRITAFDLFNSDYINGGGNTLLEKNLKLAGVAERVDIVQGDITRTGFSDEAFDAVVSSFMIDQLVMNDQSRVYIFNISPKK